MNDPIIQLGCGLGFTLQRPLSSQVPERCSVYKAGSVSYRDSEAGGTIRMLRPT